MDNTLSTTITLTNRARIPSRGSAKGVLKGAFLATALAFTAGCDDAKDKSSGNEADEATVRAFYTDLLSSPADATEARYYELFSPAVVSIPAPPGGPGAQGMINTIAFLGQVVPDLTWDVEELIALDDGRFVVRGEASGTPVGPFFGVDPATGRTFSVMSIDIVTLQEGKIVQIYHVEDWTSAIAQLTSAE